MLASSRFDDASVRSGRAFANELIHFAVRALSASGFWSEDARACAVAMVDAELRGLSSHGLQRLPLYVESVSSGRITPHANVRVVHDSGCAVVYDAGASLGFYPANIAVDRATVLAGEFGLGVVGLRRSGHFGAAGYFARMIAGRGDMVGFVCSNTSLKMTLDGGVTAIAGTNPFAISLPRLASDPLVVDMATSQSALGKVRAMAERGCEVPSTWGLDASGKPTNDPSELLKEGAMLLPMGGAKGLALAFLIDLLAGVMLDAPSLDAADSVGEKGNSGCGQIFVAVRDDVFGHSDHKLCQRVEEWVSRVRRLDKKVRIPGEAGAVLRKRRLEEGVPISGPMRRSFDLLASGLGVERLRYDRD